MGPARRRWATIKQERRESVPRRAGYRQAKGRSRSPSVFGRRRERRGVTHAELAARIDTSQPASLGSKPKA